MCIRDSSLIEQINGTLLSVLHECRIIYVTVEDKDLTSRVTDLIKDAQAYAGYMLSLIHIYSAWKA